VRFEHIGAIIQILGSGRIIAVPDKEIRDARGKYNAFINVEHPIPSAKLVQNGKINENGFSISDHRVNELSLSGMMPTRWL
jgi:hypothetical protein